MEKKYNLRKLLPVLLIGLILSSFSIFNAKAGTKYALVIGIGSQPEHSDWPATSAANDILIVSNALKQKGFDSITVLKDSEATKIAIISEMNRIRRQLKAGDVFYLHFSGHGQKLADNNADELDGFDESLVAYGAPAYYDAHYQDEHHIRDDQLSSLIDAMRRKLGSSGEVFVLLDAGFGPISINRNDSSRGSIKAMHSEYFENTAFGKDADAGIYEDRPFGMPAMSYAPIITISAGLSHQAAFEYQGNGALTLAFDRAIENSPSHEPFYNMFKRMGAIVTEMGISQRPIIEGYYKNNIAAFHADIVDPVKVNYATTEKDLQIMQALEARQNESVRRYQMEQDPRYKSMF